MRRVRWLNWSVSVTARPLAACAAYFSLTSSVVRSIRTALVGWFSQKKFLTDEESPNSLRSTSNVRGAWRGS